MKAKTTLINNDFKPMKLEINIETEAEFKVLYAIFWADDVRMMAFLNSGLNDHAKFDMAIIKQTANPIYHALREAQNEQQ